LPPLIDLNLRQVDAHDLRLRMISGERDHVSSRGAADLEDTCGGYGGGFQPEEEGSGRQMPGGRLRERV
jgi:hypothetical protein